MSVSFKQFSSNEERRTAFMNMVHAKDVWEEKMQAILSQRHPAVV